jgi:hypothetical protein
MNNEEQRIQEAMAKVQQTLLDAGILTRLEQDGTFIRIIGFGEKGNYDNSDNKKE